MIAAKADGNGIINVLGVPFYGPDNGRDVHGQYFSPNTNFMEGVIPNPPVFYYHGSKTGSIPFMVGDITKSWRDDRGIWYKIKLFMGDDIPDGIKSLGEKAVSAIKTHAQRLYEAAISNNLYASSGAVPASIIVDDDGQILQWLIGELSLIDYDPSENRKPANFYASALPVSKLNQIYRNCEYGLCDIEGNPVSTDFDFYNAMVDIQKPRERNLESVAEADAEEDDPMEDFDIVESSGIELKAFMLKNTNLMNRNEMIAAALDLVELEASSNQLNLDGSEMERIATYLVDAYLTATGAMNSKSYIIHISKGNIMPNENNAGLGGSLTNGNAAVTQPAVTQPVATQTQKADVQQPATQTQSVTQTQQVQPQSIPTPVTPAAVIPASDGDNMLAQLQALQARNAELERIANENAEIATKSAIAGFSDKLDLMIQAGKITAASKDTWLNVLKSALVSDAVTKSEGHAIVDLILAALDGGVGQASQYLDSNTPPKQVGVIGSNGTKSADQSDQGQGTIFMNNSGVKGSQDQSQVNPESLAFMRRIAGLPSQ